ncbi:MAG: hypothetical protein KKF93_04860, partial [Candidatus Omnitrophica bacterium]|nr:hypothetical protein [Candidatus Omnitrophota bacterium]
MGSQKIKDKSGFNSAGLDFTLLDKIPPQNIEAEMAVLGSILIEEEVVTNAIELLDEDCFYKENHRIIY